jgi:drug/metabolite transporter (DMT)-like permease
MWQETRQTAVMWIAMAVMTLVFVLGLASAVVQVRKGQWWTAGAVFLPVLGMVVMLLGGVERQSTSLFWLGCLFVAAGFGAEAMAYWRTRTLGREQAGQ